MAPGARVYTDAELLSLRAIPNTGRFFTRPRTAVRHLFAPGSGDVLISTSDGKVITSPGPLAAHARAFLPVMRYGRGLASLNLYPTSAVCVSTNEFLWRVAQAGEYDASGDRLLCANVLALVMSEDLFVFLRSVTLPELHNRILHFLAMLVADETDEGLDLMMTELESNTWTQLSALLDRGEQPCADQLRDIEALRRMCYLSPWRVDVYAAYVPPSDMRTVLAVHDADVDATLSAPSDSYEVADMGTKIRARAPSKNVVYWKLFRDWQTYRRIWVGRLDVHPADACTAMMAAIASGRHNEAWYRTEVVLMCAARKGNLFSQLPKDVVCNLLAPHVLLAGCAERSGLAFGNDSSSGRLISPAVRD